MAYFCQRIPLVEESSRGGNWQSFKTALPQETSFLLILLSARASEQGNDRVGVRIYMCVQKKM